MQINALRAAFRRDARDWQRVAAQLGAASVFYWHMDAADEEKAWPIETRPFVLFGREETARHGLPCVECFVYSDTRGRLVEDLSRCYGPRASAHLNGSGVIYQDPPGGWADPSWFGPTGRSVKVEVEIVEVIPLILDGVQVPLLDGAHKTTTERFPQGLVTYLAVETRYGGKHRDERHHVLFSPRAPQTVSELLLDKLAISPHYIARSPRRETWSGDQAVALRIGELAAAVRHHRPALVHAQAAALPLEASFVPLPSSPHFPQSPFESSFSDKKTLLHRPA